jgi:hypothetical protein
VRWSASRPLPPSSALFLLLPLISSHASRCGNHHHLDRVLLRELQELRAITRVCIWWLRSLANLRDRERVDLIVVAVASAGGFIGFVMARYAEYAASNQ